MTKRFFGALLGGVLFAGALSAQAPKSYDAGDVKQLLKKLNVLGTVLYVAAHPDDENTAVISYFANEELYRTAYLSATRGDGGQNLIGPEIREKLGIIRTQELLAARRTDGGQQFFSRANDFGYSKNAAETQAIWNREEVLMDFIRVYRKFRPDIIVTRFTEELGGHGHHLTSAILAREAFKLSGDPEAFKDQIGHLEPWQPKKLFWNTSWWFYRFRGEKMDTTGMLSVDVGAYNPSLGQTYTEISARSRSMHKSQGFGSTGSRGTNKEYLVQFDGEKTNTIFGGIETSWNRVEGSKQVAEYLWMANDNYNAEEPEETLKALFAAKKELGKLKDQFWKDIKLKEIDIAIAAVSGLYLEMVADDFSYVAGDSIAIKIEAISRLTDGFQLESVSLKPWDKDFSLALGMSPNQKVNHDLKLKLPEDMELSQPYWLREPSSLGMYAVSDAKKIGRPENIAPIRATFTLKNDNQYFEFERDVVFKRTDPVKGEVYRPVAIVPPVAATVEGDVVVFASNEAKSVNIKLQAGTPNIGGKLSIKVPEGWSVSPAFIDFSIEAKGEVQNYSFNVSPPSSASIGEAKAVIELADGTTISKGIKTIEYDHIPVQTLFPESKVSLVKLDLKKAGNRIGYIEGAGDLIPTNLEQIGYEVDMLTSEEVTAENLAQYDAVVLGVRAFNTVYWLAYKNKELFKYAENGGTVLVQYCTNRRLVTEDIAPYDIKLSRDRVTVEEAEVRVLNESHPIVQGPNKITSADFEGWVQERGLYFANEWADEFEPIFSANDPDEPARDGGLLVAKHGKGYYIYSGYSWFRELPAGVPGAYRIFVNLLSLGSQPESK